MEIREAFLKAADAIEKAPGIFEFGLLNIPDSCGSPGCALGLIGHFLGMNNKEHTIGHDVCKAIGIEYDVCFGALTEVTGSNAWIGEPEECVKALRMYADVHHPETKKTTRKDMPEKVRKIFDTIFEVA